MNIIKRKIFGKYIFLSKNDPGISQTLKKKIFFRKWHREPEFMDIINENINENETVCDLGANIGYATLLMNNKVGLNGKIIAIEPSESNYKLLKKTINENKINHKVKLLHKAVSNYNGTTTFYLTKESNLNSLHKNKHSIKRTNIECITLDTVMEKFGKFSFVKMDIEGGELEALEGASKIIEDTSIKIKFLIEIHPMYFDKQKFKKILKKMFLNKFVPKYLISAGVSNPDFLKEKKFKPKKIYATGDFKRGVFENIDENTFINACCEDHNQIVNITLVGKIKKILKNPLNFRNFKFKSNKIVRSIYLERI